MLNTGDSRFGKGSTGELSARDTPFGSSYSNSGANGPRGSPEPHADDNTPLESARNNSSTEA